MKVVTWTPELDYAVAFGSGLGLSNREIAALLGPEFTRNTIIGRRHRIGLTAGAPSRSPKLKNGRTRNLKGTFIKSPDWSESEIATLRANHLKKPFELRALLPGRSIAAISTHRRNLGLFQQRRFSIDEDAIIRNEWVAHTPVQDIATRLDRSYGNVSQRIVKLGLKRDGRKTRLAKRWGIEALSISDDPHAIMAHFSEIERKAKETKQAEIDAAVMSALDAMDVSLGEGLDRRVAFQIAMALGATLQQVGDRVGITRERVRQIVDNVKPWAGYIPRAPRAIECKHCHTVFTVSGKGARMYCDTPSCRADRQESREAAIRAYQTEYRNRTIAKSGRKKWKTRASVKEKILSMSKEELADIFADLAASLKAHDNVQ